MQEKDLKQRSKYINGIVLNGVFICIILVLVYSFVVPPFDEMNTLIVTINDNRTANSHLRESGINSGQFSELTTQYDKKKELDKEIFSDSEKLEKVLQKPTSFVGDYLSWAAVEAGKVGAISGEIAENERILGNIIPNYANALAKPTEDDGPMKNQVTLQSFIDYIEKDILAKYSLTSFGSLGIDNVAFDATKIASANLGSFSISLDFQWKNSDIYSFVDAIQHSGKLVIRDGKLVPDQTSRSTASSDVSDLSNLLIGIKSLTLTSLLENSSKPNGGTVVLEFYVEGMNYQKLLILRNSIATKFETLKKGVQDNWELCSRGGNALCNESSTNAAVSSIKNLGTSLSELQPSIDGLKQGQAVTDLTSELSSLSTLQSTIRNLELIYARNLNIVTKAKTKPIRK